MDKHSIVYQLPDDRWEKFVNEHPFGNIFQTPKMFQLFNSIPQHKGFLVALVSEKQDVLGLISGCLIAEPGLKSFFSRRLIVFGGPLVSDNDPSILHHLLEAYNKVARNKAIYTQFRNIWPLKKLDASLQRHHFKYEDHLTVINDLTVTEAEIVNNINKKRLSSIRSSIKKGLQMTVIEDDALLDKAVNLITMTYKRVKVPGPPTELFYQARKILGEHIQFFGSMYKNELVAVRVCLRYKELIYDWYAGSDLQYAKMRPNDILPMECLLWGKNMNGKVYDFGGAGKPGQPYGVRDFKLQYGGTLTNYGRYTRIHNNLMYKIGEWGVKMMKGPSKLKANTPTNE